MLTIFTTSFTIRYIFTFFVIRCNFTIFKIKVINKIFWEIIHKVL